MTAGLAGRAEVQDSAACTEVQVAVGGTGFLYHDDAFAEIEGGDRFVGVLAAVLQIGRAAQHVGATAVEDEKIVVIGRGPVGIGPEQVDTRVAAANGGVVGHAPAKIVDDAGAGERWRGGATGGEVALPDAGGGVVLVAGVAGGGEEQYAGFGDGIDRLGDDHVLEGRLIEVRDIIDDDGASGGLQGKDVAGKTGVTIEGGGKEQFGAGQQVLDDFHHRCSLVAQAGLTPEGAGAGVQLASGFGGDQGVHAIGEHADFQTRAVNPVGGARLHREMSGVALGEHGAEVGYGLDGGLDESNSGLAGDGFELFRGDAGAQAVKARHRGDDFAAGDGDELLQCEGDVAADVDQQAAIGLRADSGFKRGQGGEVSGALLPFEQVDELRVEPGLGRTALVFFRQQGGDLRLGSLAETLGGCRNGSQGQNDEQNAEEEAREKSREHGSAADVPA